MGLVVGKVKYEPRLRICKIIMSNLICGRREKIIEVTKSKNRAKFLEHTTIDKLRNYAKSKIQSPFGKLMNIVARRL